MKPALYFLFILIFFCDVWVLGQTKNTNNGRGQQNNNTGSGKLTVNNTYNFKSSKAKNQVLRVDKYIDTSKPISINCGNIIRVQLNRLRRGVHPFSEDILLGKDRDSMALKIRLYKSHLLVSSTVYSIDGEVIGKMVDNILQVHSRLKPNFTDKYLELFDNRDFPVLQIDLDKRVIV